MTREGKAGWTVRLVQGAKGNAHSVFVWFELLGDGRNVELNLTTSEARTLAAQLLALADAEDIGLGLAKEVSA